MQIAASEKKNDNVARKIDRSFSWTLWLREAVPKYLTSPLEFETLRQVCFALKEDVDATTQTLWGGRFGNLKGRPGIPFEIAKRVELLIPQVNYPSPEEFRGTPFAPGPPTKHRNSFVGRGKRPEAVPFAVHHKGEDWNLAEPFLAGSYALYQLLKCGAYDVHERLREAAMGQSWSCWRPGDIDVWFPGRPTVDWLAVVLHWRLKTTFPFLTFSFGTVNYGDPTVSVNRRDQRAYIRDFAEILGVDGAGCEKLRINLIAVFGKEPTPLATLNTFDLEICRVGFKPRKDPTLPPVTFFTGKGFWNALAKAEGDHYLQHENLERARARREKYQSRGYEILNTRCRLCGAEHKDADARTEYKQHYCTKIVCISKDFVCKMCYGEGTGRRNYTNLFLSDHV